MILEGTGKKEGSREEGGTQWTLVLRGGMKEGRAVKETTERSGGEGERNFKR